MKPEEGSKRLLGVTRSLAKLKEFEVEEEYHLKIYKDPANLLILTLGIIGDVSSSIARREAGIKEAEQENLMFAAHYFDSYLSSNQDNEFDSYLLLLGSASYYLCDLPGSSSVLASKIVPSELSLECEGLEILLGIILKDINYIDIEEKELFYKEEIKGVIFYLNAYYKHGTHRQELIDLISSVRETAYVRGVPRELLFSDILLALILEKINRSSRNCLPKFTGVDIKYWEFFLQEDKIFKEFWPSQILLGEKGVFNGDSAIIQLPTSAGKTKSIELIIRSSFASGRTRLAIIVAPFKALCHEVTNSLKSSFKNEDILINELSEVLQEDFLFGEIFEQNTIVVTTPEKLIYILRHSPDLAKEIRLLIYDEGHQFDSGDRGVKYELLITTLNQMIPEDAQKVLISAVIRNADSINDWLNGERGVKVSGLNYSPTYKSIAFVDWQSEFGQLKYINTEDLNTDEYFVPRIITQVELEKKKRERRPRFLPQDKNDTNGVALMLGLKSVTNGSVAIFAGTKTSINAIYKKIIDAYERNISLPPPKQYSNEKEILNMYFLFKENLGEYALSTQCSALGFLSHSGDIPLGLRAAIEYSVKEELSRFIICTSTLAQGVNLPLKYLILTNLQQGYERIKTRDFHNLIGRVGRAGMHTEGSIIFANPKIYSEKLRSPYTSGWRNIGSMLIPTNSEEVESSLHNFFNNIIFESGYISGNWQEKYWTVNQEYLFNLINYPENSINLATQKGSQVAREVESRLKIIETIESFVMANWENLNSNGVQISLVELATQTLAYSQANDEMKMKIIMLFEMIREKIETNIQDEKKIKKIGKTLFGVNKALIIYEWTKLYIENLLEAQMECESLIDVVWPLFTEVLESKYIQESSNLDLLKYALLEWLHGTSYTNIHKFLLKNRITFKDNDFLITDVVNLCDQVFSYQGALIISAIVEFITEEYPELAEQLNELQKKVKFGLESEVEINLFKLGFNDRIVVQTIIPFINKRATSLQLTKIAVIRNKKEISVVLEENFPRYFLFVINNL